MAAGANSNVSSQLQGFPIHVAVKAQSVLCLQELVAHNPSQLQMKVCKHIRKFVTNTNYVDYNIDNNVNYPIPY